MLSAVVERLLKALREARPATVRQFFALAGQHMRWELNDLARRLDDQPRGRDVLRDGPGPADSGSGLTPDGRRMLDGDRRLPADEREAFDLVRIQGMTHAEAAEVLGVSRPDGEAAAGPRPAAADASASGDLRPATRRSTRPEAEVRRRRPRPGRRPCPTTRACNNCSTSCSTPTPRRKRCASRARNCCPRSATGGGRCAASGPNSTPCSRPRPGRGPTRPAATAEARALPAVPGYEVEAVLGRGGMGVVFRARHLRLNRVVALKMILAGAYAGPHERDRFQREAEAVAGLQHPNIVQVHDVGDTDGRPYFTMEFVDGGSLAQKLAGHPQPAREAAAWWRPWPGPSRSAHAGRDRPPRPEAGQRPARPPTAPPRSPTSGWPGGWTATPA